MNIETILKRAVELPSSWERNAYFEKHLKKSLKEANLKNIEVLLDKIQPKSWTFLNIITSQKQSLTRPVLNTLVEHFKKNPDEYSGTKIIVPYSLLFAQPGCSKTDKEWLLAETVAFLKKTSTGLSSRNPYELAGDPDFFSKVKKDIPWENLVEQKELAFVIFSGSNMKDLKSDIVDGFIKEMVPRWSDDSVFYVVNKVLQQTRQLENYTWTSVAENIKRLQKNLLFLKDRIKNLQNMPDQNCNVLYANLSCVKDEHLRNELSNALSEFFKKVNPETRDAIDIANSTPRGVELVRAGNPAHIEHAQKSTPVILKQFILKSTRQMPKDAIEKILKSLPNKERENFISEAFLGRTYDKINYENFAHIANFLSEKTKKQIAEKIINKSIYSKRLVSILIKGMSVDEVQSMKVDASYYSKGAEEWLKTKVAKKSKKEIKDQIMPSIKKAPTTKRRM